jgi:dihydrofolate reductase
MYAILSTLSNCLVAGLFMTLDGVVESPGTWQEHFDEDMGEAMMEQLTSQDAVLLGRVTYQEWAYNSAHRY